ncbi:SDR family oxidoreductase [Sphingobium sp. HBC34]|uniref:SDR family oxidoreductase n=1 Tax=Sphingobium cyanobacteriorum TaxID=3063954 RepID=A0ABT8ZTB1_9SPHN|nr:SDR family oxidoreductase [Sphingobium sp. HBC34]MDO7836696.1 SDR family oxidoreductase [Sphingobium sp. HBC34]
MASIGPGRTAVVTGGGSGIGLELARALAGEGMHVVICGRSQDRLEKAAKMLRDDSGAVVEAIVCDVADRAQVRAMAGQVEARFGAVDMLCANAGVTTAGEYRDHQDADWDWTLGVNLAGATNSIQAFYPVMTQRGSGTILITGSQTSLVPDWVVGHGPYVPAKAALVALVFALRPEAEKYGVQVSLLLPSATDTAMGNPAGSRQVTPGAQIMPRDGMPMPEAPFFLSPQEVAARAISGVKANHPLIVTHAGMRPLVKHHLDRILDAYDQAAAWQPA